MKKLMIMAGVIALAIYIAKRTTIDREQWEGLTEDDLRNRLDERLPHQIPDDKRQMITDRIVEKMRDRGALGESADVDTIDLSDAEAPTAESVG